MNRPKLKLPAPLTRKTANGKLKSHDGQGKIARITFSDKGPDSLGRRSFTLEWNSTHPLTGQRYTHGQCYFAVPEDHFIPDS